MLQQEIWVFIISKSKWLEIVWPWGTKGLYHPLSTFLSLPSPVSLLSHFPLDFFTHPLLSSSTCLIFHTRVYLISCVLSHILVRAFKHGEPEMLTARSSRLLIHKSTSTCQFPWIKHLWNVSIMCLFQNYKMLFAWLCIYFTTINSPWVFIWKNHCLQEVNTSKYSWILYLIILLFL